MASGSPKADSLRESGRLPAAGSKPSASVRAGEPSAAAILPEDAFSREIAQQAHALDEDVPRIAEQYSDQYVAYYRGTVLGHGPTPSDAVAGLGPEVLALPFVIRYLDAAALPDDMGGPKEE